MPDYSSSQYPPTPVRPATTFNNTQGYRPNGMESPAAAAAASPPPKSPRAISNEQTSGTMPAPAGPDKLSIESDPKMSGLIQFAQNKMLKNGPFMAGNDVDLSDYPDYGNFSPNQIDAAKATARALTQGMVNTLGNQGVMPKYDMYAKNGTPQPGAAGSAPLPPWGAGPRPSSGGAHGEDEAPAASGQISPYYYHKDVNAKSGNGSLDSLIEPTKGAPADLAEKAKSLNPDDWKGFFKLAGDILDAAGVSLSAYAGNNRQTRLQQAFANNLMIEQQRQKAMNEANATISTLEPQAQAKIKQIIAEYEASGNKDVFVSKMNQARNLQLIDEQQYTNILRSRVSPANMLGGGATAAVNDLTGPGGMKRD